ncbi:MAG: hypothetical protein GYA60_00970 [Candidatus Methanofastidiosa archaeon]|nr:hypothetical protein [Candidatus Methanofastidiosa archaeon]
MVKPKKANPESMALEAVHEFINKLFPEDFESAVEEFSNVELPELVLSDLQINREFQAWYMLKHKVSGIAAPIEMASTYPFEYFTEEEKNIIDNFFQWRESFFEIKKILDNKRDFLVLDLVTGQECIVETIKLDKPFNVGDVLSSIIIRKLNGNYFFYGNIGIYKGEGAKEMKKEIKKIGTLPPPGIWIKVISIDWKGLYGGKKNIPRVKRD